MRFFLIISMLGLQELPNNTEYVHNKAVTKSYQAKVVGVSDGDTITVLTEQKERIKIRFDSIDAPESKQAFGKRAKQALSESIFGKTVTVQEVGKDRYKRTLAFVKLDGKDVATAMVKNGFAWEYKRYSDSDTLSDLQAVAKKAKVGLWKQDAVAPWEYRKRKTKTLR